MSKEDKITILTLVVIGSFIAIFGFYVIQTVILDPVIKSTLNKTTA